MKGPRENSWNLYHSVNEKSFGDFSRGKSKMSTPLLISCEFIEKVDW